MNNKMYLIQDDDYLKHIDDKVFLYLMVKQLSRKVSKLSSNRGSKALSHLSDSCNALAERMFRTWGIPKSYLYSSDPNELALLMSNELIEPEEAGYVAYDGNYPCCKCCCPETEDDSYDDFDEEGYDEYLDEEAEDEEDEELCNLIAGLSTTIHKIFGDKISIHVIVEE